MPDSEPSGPSSFKVISNLRGQTHRSDMELPPLVPDSAVSADLYRLWSGQRVVHSYPARPRTGSGQAITKGPERAAEVVAHLHLRAGFSVNVVYRNDKDGHRFESRLREMLPGLSSHPEVSTRALQPDGTITVLTQEWLSEGFITMQAHFEQPHPHRADLIVLLDTSQLTPARVYTYLLAGRQIYVPCSSTSVFTEVFLQPDRVEVPVDVALAGGV